MNQLRQENQQAFEKQHSEFRNQHSSQIEGLRSEQRRMEAERNAEIEQLRREQDGLNKQLAEANQRFQELQNRPGKSTKCIKCV